MIPALVMYGNQILQFYCHGTCKTTIGKITNMKLVILRYQLAKHNASCNTNTVKIPKRNLYFYDKVKFKNINVKFYSNLRKITNIEPSNFTLP